MSYYPRSRSFNGLPPPTADSSINTVKNEGLPESPDEGLSKSPDEGLSESPDEGLSESPDEGLSELSDEELSDEEISSVYLNPTSNALDRAFVRWYNSNYTSFRLLNYDNRPISHIWDDFETLKTQFVDYLVNICRTPSPELSNDLEVFREQINAYIIEYINKLLEDPQKYYIAWLLKNLNITLSPDEIKSSDEFGAHGIINRIAKYIDTLNITDYPYQDLLEKLYTMSTLKAECNTLLTQIPSDTKVKCIRYSMMDVSEEPMNIPISNYNILKDPNNREYMLLFHYFRPNKPNRNLPLNEYNEYLTTEISRLQRKKENLSNYQKCLETPISTGFCILL